MKMIITLASLLITALAGASFAEDPPAALDAPMTALAGVMRTPESEWTAEDLARFYAARAQMNAILTQDLDDPMVNDWFQHGFDPGTWLTYGPATQYLIIRHEPLAIDEAYLFRTFVNRMADNMLDIYSEDAPSSCLSVKALRLLENGAASPEEEQFLNAVHIADATMRLMLRPNAFRSAVGIDPAFAGAAGDDPALLKEQDTISGIMGGMLFNAAATGLPLYSDDVLNDLWMDPMTGAEYPQDWVNRAAQQLGASDLPKQLAAARPVLTVINAQRDQGTDALLTALCD